MRRVILAVMIVLLPLRGWMGDVMAMDTVAIAQNAIQSIAEYDHLTMGPAHSDADSGLFAARGSHGHCPDHASADANAPGAVPDGLPGTGAHDDSADADSDHAAHGGACTVCQVCHTVAMSADAAPLPALPLLALAPEMSFPSFTSALPAPGLKPPIS
jgi:hypothetical protein